ncbi:DUF6188 family protein [Nocardia sp. NPDC056064]|uniref:DUF6188 family protein n=1 Tax=Nocardia sp. NPDC056064 TaxID=3345701 RepID=UPI0035E1F8C6
MWELDDRWILPLRGNAVTGISWHGDSVTMSLENSFSLAVGSDAYLTPGTGRRNDVEAKPVFEWHREVAERAMRSQVVSSVGFKSGTIRIRFHNGWGLVARIGGGVQAVVMENGRVLWAQVANAGADGNAKYRRDDGIA